MAITTTTVQAAMEQWARMDTHEEPFEDALRAIWAKPTFLGVRAAQAWSDFYNWERFLNAHPVGAIVELGTWAGGFSLFLLLQCIQRGAKFATFDTAPCPAWPTPVSKLLGLEGVSYTEDIFAGGGHHVRRLLAQLPGPVLLFCDNGNKPREFQHFVPMLQPGDFAAVHDWGTEFNQPDVDPVAGLVEPVWVAESEAVGTVTRWYRRV